MRKKPLISIIIPTYNRASLIDETLDSVVSQTYTHWECIVVDDGSTDKTQEILQKRIASDTRFYYYKRPLERLKGGNAARNYGFEVSKGAFVLWYDSDDVMLPRKLERHLEMFIEDQTIDATVTNSFLYNFTSKNAYLPWRKRLYSDDLVNDFISLEAGWSIGDSLWKKSYLKTLRYNEILQSSQDWEFHMKAILLNTKFVFDTQCFSYIRHTPNSIKNTNNKDKIVSQFQSRKSVLEFNKIHPGIGNKGYLYIFNELFDYFFFFIANGRIKFSFQSLKWIVKITLYTKAYKLFFSNLFFKGLKKTINKLK